MCHNAGPDSKDELGFAELLDAVLALKAVFDAFDVILTCLTSLK